MKILLLPDDPVVWYTLFNRDAAEEYLAPYEDALRAQLKEKPFDAYFDNWVSEYILR